MSLQGFHGFPRKDIWTAPWYLSGYIYPNNCIAAYQPKGAASLADSYKNIANPGVYDAAPGTAPTWSATAGWIFAAASSQYLTNGITPTNTWSVLVRCSDQQNGGDTWVFGNYNATGWGIQPLYLASTRYYNGTTVTVGGGDRVNGVWGLVGAQGYFNGLAEGAATAGNASLGAAMFIGDISGAYRRYFTGYIQSMAIYNVTLTAAQVWAVSYAMNVLALAQ